MTESKAAVPAGVQQEQLEAEEKRRSVVLLLLGLAAAILAFWPGVFHLMAGAAFSASAAFEGVAGGNVVLVGYNGSQKFFVWAPPG
jgi:thiamine transporter ThiT